jgi:hypothetical protein
MRGCQTDARARSLKLVQVKTRKPATVNTGNAVRFKTNRRAKLLFQPCSPPYLAGETLMGLN